MNGGRNVMIRASAGSGKTYALTNRYVALLAGGAGPERIVALTFTRKAAGEFFDEILNKLARAAGEAAYREQIARDIGRPGLGRGDFLRMLRAVIEEMSRLRLGTLDSFFAQIARAFPFELGLTGDFEVLEDYEARMERRRTLRRLFVGDDQTQGRSDFIEAFKRSTFGAEGKRFGRQLDEFLDHHQEVFLETPNTELWGRRERIWPEGCEWLDGAEPDKELAVAALGGWLAGDDMEEGQRRRWREFLEDVEAWAPGAPITEPLKYILKKALENWAALRAGTATLVIERRKQELGAAACGPLAALVKIVFRGELTRKMEATRGVCDVLRGYERHYDDAVRRTGKLTFGDVQRLLEPVVLTQVGGEPGAESRLLVDYRIDGGIDHWLLDEFQDTSRGQWSILENLVDEAIQDDQRSFFCVGDVKQSIFTWRGGDHRLFGEILARYNGAAPGTIAEERRDLSRRSGPPIIEMVNAVFGAGAAISGLFPGGASAAWNAEWRAHESAVPERGGHAALVLATGEEGRWRTALELLREIRPRERGLSCAVLVRKNDTGIDFADYLKREGGLPAVAESDVIICGDNPLGSAMLALFQAAAHPGDRFAWEHLRMTPLGRVIEAEGLGRDSKLTARVLSQVHTGGFERTSEAWLRKLEPWLDPKDAFTRLRARQFAEAAGRFDHTGSRNLDEFREFMEGCKIRDVETAGTIRVMTIHKAKGLDFDVVLLPDLEGSILMGGRSGLGVQRAADGSVRWILDMPAGLFSGNDPILAAHEEEEEAEACYESLSLFYVAMTRAKRALYAISEPVKKGSASRSFPKLLAETLGGSPQPLKIGSLELEGAWSSGDPGWLGGLGRPKRASVEREPMAPLDPKEAPAAARRAARRPSAARTGTLSGGMLFAGQSAADFGEAVHALLARIEWLEPGAAPPADAPEGPAAEEARACLAAPELSEVWKEPAAGGQVWRERPFEGVIDGAWVTGRFDRVVLACDKSGRPVKAAVFDFKTDRLEEGADLAAEAARHAGQLGLYRGAVAMLAGIPPSAVRCEVVFTQVRRSVPVR